MDEAVKEYELLCILSPKLEGIDLDKIKDEITEAINRLEGTISFKELNKKPLAYPINKERQGIYLISHISINPEKIVGLSKELKLKKQILRHLISNLEIPKVAEENEKLRKTKRTISPKRPAIKKEEETTSRPKEETLKEIDKKLDELIGEI